MYKYSYRKSQGAVWFAWLLTCTPSFSLFFAPFHWLGCVISCSYHSQSSSFYFQDLLSFWWVIWIFLSLVWLFCADLYFRAGLSIIVLILLIMCFCVCDLRYVLDSFWSCSHCTCMCSKRVHCSAQKC